MAELSGGSTVNGYPVVGKKANDNYIPKLNGNTVVNSNLYDDGTVVKVSSPINSIVATGTAPLQVTSTTVVSNLNADMVDGYHASAASSPGTLVVQDSNQDITVRRYISTVTTGTAPLTVASTTVVTNLNADMVDGYHLDQDVRKTSNVTFNTVNAAAMASGGRDVLTRAALLPEGTNLNNLIVEGEYYCPANSSAGTMGNVPTAQAFHMKVSRHAGVNQTFTVFYAAGSAPEIWTRNMYEYAWSSWQRIYHSGNIIKSTAGPSGGNDGDIWLQYS
ncbi:pyocin knob domain-containing protein [Paenibacillus sp. FSL H3-0333]|uniref:pyocin knob domain-containing protein n=1 Tax=Paenibacillus sp. FSL H3-0333 TaxID=2921373 RepID=UPI0030F5723C